MADLPSPQHGKSGVTPLLLTEREAVQVLRLCARTLAKLRKSGDLPFIRSGSAVRYSVRDLEEFIARHRQGGRQ